MQRHLAIALRASLAALALVGGVNVSVAQATTGSASQHSASAGPVQDIRCPKHNCE
ncbi:hypothetical protein ABZS94_39090 [Streptomyces sp. NPDC005500]|uniref:hypothetical protein n=1 Tax=Streptomyces sp. NPDC005500 TaxID=3155007 RepID=UPI0033B43DED